MSAPLNPAGVGSCCLPACSDLAIAQIPGPDGTDGIDGENGEPGANSYTSTTATFVQPAASASVSVAVLDSAWAIIGQIVYVATGGYYEVSGIADSTHLTLTNLDYPGNAAAAANVVSPAAVGPGGLQGPAGAATSTTFNDLSPSEAKGDLILDNGANNPNASNVRLAVGTNGKILIADSSQAVGVRWDSIDLAGTNTSLVNELPVARGGTNASSAAAARTSLGTAASGLATASGLTLSATDKVLGRSTAGAGAVEEITVTSFARTFLDDADAATARTTLGVSAPPYLLYQNQQTSGTGGGAFSNSAWRTVPLNTEVADTGNNGTLATNFVTLQPGTYRFRAWVSAFAVDGFQARLYNITTTSVIAYGLCSTALATDTGVSQVWGRFTLGGVTQISLEAQCVTTNGTNGFGKALSFGTEIYASLELEKE